MSSQASLRSFMLTILGVRAASGATSTDALLDSRGDIFSPERALQVLVSSWQEQRHGARVQAARQQDDAFERSHARIGPSVGC